MGSAADAFGVFTHDLEGKDAIVVFAAPWPEAARALLNKVAEAVK
jgi:hypothetical protein